MREFGIFKNVSDLMNELQLFVYFYVEVPMKYGKYSGSFKSPFNGIQIGRYETINSHKGGKRCQEFYSLLGTINQIL